MTLDIFTERDVKAHLEHGARLVAFAERNARAWISREYPSVAANSRVFVRWDFVTFAVIPTEHFDCCKDSLIHTKHVEIPMNEIFPPNET